MKEYHSLLCNIIILSCMKLRMHRGVISGNATSYVWMYVLMYVFRTRAPLIIIDLRKAFGERTLCVTLSYKDHI